MRHWNTLNKRGRPFAETAGDAIAEAANPAEAIKGVPRIFEEAVNVRRDTGERGNWRTAVGDFLVKSGIDRRFILVAIEGVSVHEPSNDGATGPLGHLGICIWRIS
jgi:hypothetical protein